MTRTYPKSQGFGVTWFPSTFSFEGGPRKLQLKVPVSEKLQAVATRSNPRWFNANNGKVITKGKNNIFLNESYRPLLTRSWGFCIFLIPDSALAHSPAANHHGWEETTLYSTCLHKTLPEQIHHTPGSRRGFSLVASAAGSPTRSTHETSPWGTRPSVERMGKPPRAGKRFCQAHRDEETADASLQIDCRY